MEHDRHGARQPHRFDPARAHQLDEKDRFEYLPPAEVFDLLGAPENGTVIDFGTGTGTYAFELAAKRPDLRVIALDEQREMLDRVERRRTHEPLLKVEAVLAKGRWIDAFRGSADRVLALNVLHELGDAALRDLGALLKGNGEALFIDWNAAVVRHVGPPTEHVYTLSEGARKVAEAGLRVAREQLFRYHYALSCVRNVRGP